ncbi:MAG: hypothetical protein R3B72_21925 [Polyangiaceae bacterium]
MPDALLDQVARLWRCGARLWRFGAWLATLAVACAPPPPDVAPVVAVPGRRVGVVARPPEPPLVDPSPEVAPPIRWRDDLDLALEQARGLVLLHFHSTWSAGSIALTRRLDAHEGLRRALRGATAIAVDFTELDEEREARAARFGVDRVPTLLLLGPDRRERWRGEGEGQDLDALVEAIAAAQR